MGRMLKIEWQETANQLKKRYRQERHAERKIKLYAFWQLRLGKSLKEVAELIGFGYRTVQYWVMWYRQSGLSAVLRRIKGHGKQGRRPKLKVIQEKALVAKVALGSFRNIWDVMDWLQQRWQIKYRYAALRKRLKHLKCGLKVPRPCSVKADIEIQNQWKTTNLPEALQEAELTAAQRIYFSDEMRFGLWGQTRKRWGLRGVKIIQKIQIEFVWQYLVLAVDVVRCKLRWAWTTRLNQAQLIPVFEKWTPDAIIWDGASAHRGKAMGEVGFAQIFLPPYSPELNPCERVFEWLRSKIEGEVYASLQHKRHTITQYLRFLDTNKAALQSLVGWDWIQDVFAQLPVSP